MSKSFLKNPFGAYNSESGWKKRKQLDWEESAVDSHSDVEGFFDELRPKPQLWWLYILCIFCFAVIVVQLFRLQVIQGKKYSILSENNRIRKQTVLAPRGLIKDRNGELLAENTASYSLVAIPFDLPKGGFSEELQKLAQIFNFNGQEAADILGKADKNSYQPVLIKQGLTDDQSILFETKATEFLGFAVQKVPIRDYVDGPVFSPVLGYTGILSDSDKQKINMSVYDANDYIGKTNVEAAYEKYLHGQNGDTEIAVDATGKLLSILGEDSPVPGNVLVLNIDKGLQEQLYHSLEGRRAAAVAMDPTNGQVLALVSTPSFDNNLFAQGIKTEEYQALLSNKDLPLFNRAISGTYPPGSTSKIMTAAAALQEGIVSPDTVIRDTGVLTIPNQYNNGVSYQFRGWKPGGLGPMTVRSAIAMSSDIYFYTVAGGSANGAIAGLGAEKLAEYFRKFGLGQALGIDIQGEKPGLVPDPEWKMKYFKNDPLAGKWYLGDTYHMGIGQGDVLVTPLQVAEWTAVVANNGIGFKPELAQKVVDQQGKTIWESKPQKIIGDIASPQNIKVVQEGMRQTVLAGTAKPLASLPITSAGKTGTSQFDGSDSSRTHAWFTAYAPYENPRIVITVLVEAGGEGNAVAEPVVKDALKWWADNRYGK